MRVILEIFICAHDVGAKIRYHRLCRDISNGHGDPDEIIARILEETGIDNYAGMACSHSTSWRYENGKTLLTYLVWVAASALSKLPNRLLAVESVVPKTATAPLAPKPPDIDEADVLFHGLRHLNFLVCEQQEPMMSNAMEKTGAIPFIKRLSPAPAGRIHVNYRPNS